MQLLCDCIFNDLPKNKNKVKLQKKANKKFLPMCVIFLYETNRVRADNDAAEFLHNSVWMQEFEKYDKY